MSHTEQGNNTPVCFAVCVWTDEQMCSDQCTAEFERSNVIGDDHEKHVTHIAVWRASREIRMSRTNS